MRATQALTIMNCDKYPGANERRTFYCHLSYKDFQFLKHFRKTKSESINPLNKATQNQIEVRLKDEYFNFRNFQ